MNELLRDLLALPPQASSFAREVDYLHYFVISVTMLGAAATGLTALMFVAKYRRRREELTVPVSAPRWLEITWIVGLLSLFCFWWVLGYRLYIEMQTPPADSIDVYVTAKQWMWKFAYPDGRRSIAVLTVPVNRPVRLTMTSRDVIHSFSVPAFRIKQDVVPGTYTTAWFEAVQTGSFQILCAEYCGVSHSNMWARVEVLSDEDYAAWLEGHEPTQKEDRVPITAAERPRDPHASQLQDRETTELEVPEPMDVRGRQVAVKYGCFGCHTVDGRRHIGPSFAGLFGREVEFSDGTKAVADAEYLTASMMDPREKIVAGFQPVMPSFQGQLSAADAAALVELIRSLADIERGGVFPGGGTQ